MLVKDFCDRHRGEYGCTNVTVTPPPVVRSVPMKTGDSVTMHGVKKWGNPNNWSQSDMFKYDAVANIINAFHRVGIDSFLTGGSALGAYRNHGWFSWDKDADLVVVSTDYAKIERALKSISLYFYESAIHKNVTGDIPSDKDGFGYHVSIPQVGKHKTPYIDLWLFEKTKTKLQCKGFHNGCQRWCRKYSQKTCKPLSETLFYPPNYVPYGPYLMPTIRKPYLDFSYGNTWPLKCGYGKISCSSRYKTDMFVFTSKDENGNIIETAKIGEEVKHRFVIKDGEYKLLKNSESRGDLIKDFPVTPRQNTNTVPMRQNYEDIGCMEKKVDVYADVIATALRYNIRLFPRNGFLLGIVRHKGYLPHEKIDTDMGMFESDFKTDKMIGKFGTYTLRMMKKHLSWSKTWDGVHPTTGRKLPSGVNLLINGKKWKTISLFFDLNDKEVFYPKWTANHNVGGSIKETTRWIKEGAKVVISGNNRYSIFNKSAFDSVVSVDFYHRKINIPSGYKEILSNFYGRNWINPEKRIARAAEIVPKHTISSEPLDICPMSWRNCKELSKTENIHDVLFDQLKRFVSVINHTEYVIAYGTLLGVVRNNDMNPNEVDSDIIMEQTFRPTIELKQKLMRKGLVIFKHDIYRVCDYSSIKRQNYPPWVKYVPYVDIYNHLPNLKPFHAKPRVFKNKWNHSTMKIRDIYVKTPDLKTSKEWLSRTYKNWGTYVKKNTWKDRLLSKVKH